MTPTIPVNLRLAVAEDSVLLRDGLVALLTRRGFEIVAVAGDGESLLAAIAHLPLEQRPQVVVLDVRMPPSMLVSADGSYRLPSLSGTLWPWLRSPNQRLARPYSVGDTALATRLGSADAPSHVTGLGLDE